MGFAVLALRGGVVSPSTNLLHCEGMGASFYRLDGMRGGWKTPFHGLRSRVAAASGSERREKYD